MSDHVFSLDMLEKLIATPVAPGEVALAVDHKLVSIFDMEDATKVLCKEQRICAIGKDLQDYNAIDCGLFKCTTGIFVALERAMIDGDCSLSDGGKELIKDQKLRPVDIGQGFWIDIDTPEALAYAIAEL